MNDDFRNVKIGILIPTYNRHDYLQVALSSVVNQTHDNLEIVVIDNGSTDNTARYMSQINDARIRYIVNDSNLGLFGSINKGISTFSEQVNFCVVLCDDDYLENTYISEMLRFLQQHPELIVAYGHIVFIYENSGRVKNAVIGPEIEGAQSYLAGRAYGKRDSYLSSVIFHKQSFAEIGGYPSFATGWATDDALIFHLGAKGKTIGFNRNALCYIRVHENAESIGLHGGIGKNFQAALDFKNYCIKIARAYGLHENFIINFTNFRITNWITGQLLKTYEKLFFSNALKNDNAVYHEFKETLILAHDYLPVRFKANMFFVKAFGIYVERYSFYRFLWRSIRDIQKMKIRIKGLFV
jgi:glycosyltransferase involved in cell wall biosynthesis